jgi:hypothetical protein
MSLERFKSKLCSGHKDNAVQVPFDPGIRWSTPAQALRPGRRGFRVQASLNGIGFESAIVARSGKFWLLVPGEISAAANIAVGDQAALAVALRQDEANPRA